MRKPVAVCRQAYRKHFAAIATLIDDDPKHVVCLDSLPSHGLRAAQSSGAMVLSAPLMQPHMVMCDNLIERSRTTLRSIVAALRFTNSWCDRSTEQGQVSSYCCWLLRETC